MITEIDHKLEKYVINKMIEMPKLFDDLGIDYRLEGNCLCPFHENLNTPSAKIYRDTEGYKLWCFSEGRMYGSWDAFKRFTSISTKQLALYILNSISNEDRDNLLESLGHEQEIEKLSYENELKLFKQSKISYKELLSVIANSYE